MKNKTWIITILLIICITITGSYASAININIKPLSQKKFNLTESYYHKIQSPFFDDNTWIKTFGGFEDEDDPSGEQTIDGGYVIISTTKSFGPGPRSSWLVKIDENGNEEWNKTYGGSGTETGYDGHQTSDDGYIIVGFTDTHLQYPDTNVWLIKTDSSGNKEWSGTFGGKGTDIGYAVQETSDGGFIIVGRTDTYGIGDDDIWVIKTNSTGNELWNKTFGGKNFDSGGCIQQTDDNGFIILGVKLTTDSAYDFWLIKTDSNGNKEWDKTFGGDYFDLPSDLQQTSDGGYVMLGWSDEYDKWGSSGAILIKTDSLGNEEWHRFFGQHCRSVKETSDGGFIIVGDGSSLLDDGQVRLIKTDKNGRKEWSKKYGTKHCDWGWAVQQTTDEGFFIMGITSPPKKYYMYDIIAIKTDKNGSCSKFRSICQNSQQSSNPLFLWFLDRFPVLSRLFYLIK